VAAGPYSSSSSGSAGTAGPRDETMTTNRTPRRRGPSRGVWAAPPPVTSQLATWSAPSIASRRARGRMAR
jgi:hypothetical protein